MTVPTPTVRYINLNTATFTEINSPTVVDDQHGTDNAYDFDDSLSQSLSSTQTPYNTGSTTTHSHAVWIRKGSKVSGNQIIMAQSPSTFVNASFFYTIINTTLFSCFSTDGSNFVDSAILAAALDWADGEWRMLVTRVTGNIIDMFVDGVPVPGGDYFFKDSVTGAGFTGLPATPANLTIGAFSNNGSSAYDGIVARPTFWEDTVLTDAHILEFYNDEIAAIGGDPTFKSPVVNKVMDTIYPENGIIKRDLYKSP